MIFDKNADVNKKWVPWDDEVEGECGVLYHADRVEKT